MATSDLRDKRMQASRPATPVVAGIFFALASCITAATAFSLLVPGSVLDVMWRIKPHEHEQLLSAGVAAIAGFFALSMIMATASVGTFLRRRWGWWLALAIFTANGLADAARIPLGAPLEGAIGVGTAALILFWLTRPPVRRMFCQRSRPPDI